MNRIILIGHLGADAELRFTQGGQPVLSMRLATTEKWTKDGQKQERTDWHSLTLWGKRAEALAQYLTKGSRIAVEGRVQYRQYEDREGNKRWATDINVSEVELLGGGSRQSDGPRYQGSGYSGGGGGGGGDQDYRDFDDDIPF